MKKVAYLSIFVLFSWGLTACKSEDSNTGTTTQTTVNSSTKANEGTESMKTVFTGVIQENAIDGDNGSVQVFLKEVKAIQDQEDILNSFKSDGVILNIPQEVLTISKEDMVKDKALKVTLQGLPVMTMSIPPQLPGKSIEQVELVE